MQLGDLSTRQRLHGSPTSVASHRTFRRLHVWQAREARKRTGPFSPSFGIFRFTSRGPEAPRQRVFVPRGGLELRIRRLSIVRADSKGLLSGRRKEERKKGKINSVIFYMEYEQRSDGLQFTPHARICICGVKGKGSHNRFVFREPKSGRVERRSG